MRFLKYFGLLVLVLGLFVLSAYSQAPKPRSDEPTSDADYVSLIPTSIKQTNLQLELGGRSLEVPVQYAIKENLPNGRCLIFVLPVWVVEKVERVVSGQRAPLTPTDVLVPAGTNGPVQVNVTIRNLLDKPDTEKLVFEQIKRYISGQLGFGELGFRFDKPHINEGAVRFVLVGKGRGDEAQILLSNAVPSAGGLLGFDLDVAAVRRCEQLHGDSDGLALGMVEVVATGPMKVRFDRLEFEAQLSYLRSATVDFRKRVGSQVNPNGPPPDVIVPVAVGGRVDVQNFLNHCFQQALQVTISTRQGSTTEPLLPLLNKAVDLVYHHIEIDRISDDQRITFLMQNQVSITATLGEIKRLQKLDDNGRSEAFQKAYENYLATRRDQGSAVSGGLQMNVFGVGAGVTGRHEKSDSSTDVTRDRQEDAQFRQEFNRLMKLFDGSVPLPTGMKITDDLSAANLMQLGTEFSQKTFFFDYTLHRFAPIRLIGSTDIGTSVSDWMQKYAQLKAHHQVVLSQLENALAEEKKLREELKQAKAEMRTAQQKLEALRQEVAEVVRAVGKPEQWADAKTQVDRTEKRALELEKKVESLQKTLSSSEAQTLSILLRDLKILRMRVPRQVIAEHEQAVNAVAFSPDGKHLATASDDGTARIWDTATGRVISICGGHGSRIFSACFSPDGKLLATGAGDGTVRLWNPLRPNMVKSFEAHEKPVYGLCFSPDGKRIATASGDRTARIWDVITGREVLALEGHQADVTSVAFDPNQKTIVTASTDQTVRMWDAATGRLVQILRGHTSWVYTARFSDGGKYVLTASADGTARTWDSATGQSQQVLKGHTGWVYASVFGPGSKLIATASKDKTVGIWDATTGQEIYTLPTHTTEVYAVAFSPDGSLLATACKDGTVRLWAIDE